MSAPSYRTATPADLPAAAGVYWTARMDMLGRLGFPVPTDTPDAALPGYRHVLQTGIFELAEVDGKVVGKASAVVRDGLWFLSGFWVLPEYQKQKLGGPLLRRAWQKGQEQGAHTFFVWSSSDTTAMAAYMRMGMLPGCQLLTFRGDRERVVLPPAPAGYEAHPLDPLEAAAIDAVIRGTRRDVDHQYWANVPGRLLVKAGQACGYYYLNEGTVHGAWLDPRDGAALLSIASREALDQSEKVMLRVAGVNHLAINFALKHGFLFQQFSHLLTTAPFGKLDQYLASGPLLF